MNIQNTAGSTPEKRTTTSFARPDRDAFSDRSDLQVAAQIGAIENSTKNMLAKAETEKDILRAGGGLTRYLDFAEKYMGVVSDKIDNFVGIDSKVSNDTLVPVNELDILNYEARIQRVTNLIPGLKLCLHMDFFWDKLTVTEYKEHALRLASIINNVIDYVDDTELVEVFHQLCENLAKMAGADEKQSEKMTTQLLLQLLEHCFDLTHQVTKEGHQQTDSERYWILTQIHTLAEKVFAMPEEEENGEVAGSATLELSRVIDADRDWFFMLLEETLNDREVMLYGPSDFFIFLMLFQTLYDKMRAGYKLPPLLKSPNARDVLIREAAWQEVKKRLRHKKQIKHFDFDNIIKTMVDQVAQRAPRPRAISELITRLVTRLPFTQSLRRVFTAQDIQQ